MKVILNDEGMTLVELLFATLLMAFALIALLTLMMGAITTASVAKTQTQATALANERIEEVRGLNYDVDIGLKTVLNPSTTPSGALPSESDPHEQYPRGNQNFEVWYDVVWVDDQDDGLGGSDTDGDTHDYKGVTVTVSWDSSSPNRRVVVVTNIREKTPATDAPTVNFDFPQTPDNMTVVQTDDDTATPIPETVTVQATGTDTDGQIVILRFDFGGHTPSDAFFNVNSSIVTKNYGWKTHETNLDTSERWYPDGAREVKVQVWDNAGATSYRVIYLVVDNSPPSFSSENPLSGTGTNYNTVTLTWSAATDGTDRVEHYFVYRSTDGIYWTRTSVGPSDLSYNPTTGNYTYEYGGLQPWTNYQFYIEARSPLNVQNGSGDFAVASNTDTDNTTLIKLTGITDKSSGKRYCRLEWEPPTRAGVTFDVYRNGSCINYNATSPYTDNNNGSGLPSETTYSYYIQANGDGGNVSNTISLTTPK